MQTHDWRILMRLFEEMMMMMIILPKKILLDKGFVGIFLRRVTPRENPDYSSHSLLVDREDSRCWFSVARIIS